MPPRSKIFYRFELDIHEDLTDTPTAYATPCRLYFTGQFGSAL